LTRALLLAVAAAAAAADTMGLVRLVLGAFTDLAFVPALFQVGTTAQACSAGR